MTVLLFGIILGSLEDCYDELGSRYQLPIYVLSAPANLQLDSSDVDELPEKLSPSSKKRKRGSELPIRLQLSTGPVMRLAMRSNDSVLVVKQHVAAMADVGAAGVRLFFAGKQLTDNARLKDAGLRKNYTVQAVLSEAGLSDTSASIDAAGGDVQKLTSFTKEPRSAPEHDLPTSTEVLAVSAEQIGTSVAAVPTTESVENSEQVRTSAALVLSIEPGFHREHTGTSSAVVDSSMSSALPKDVAGSSHGLDAPS